ncbi:MAG: hypothetical protein ACXVAT_17385 [Isosphaeraceae bacterium]
MVSCAPTSAYLPSWATLYLLGDCWQGPKVPRLKHGIGKLRETVYKVLDRPPRRLSGETAPTLARLWERKLLSGRR